MNNPASRRAFALRDLTTLTALAGIGVALFVPLAVHAGGQSRMSVCMSRLKSIGMSTARYGLDHQDRLAALQGTPGRTVQYGNPGLNQTIFYSNNAQQDRQSVSDQVIDIIRRRGNRNDIPTIPNWVGASHFSYLAIVEHEQEPLPSARWACPEDTNLLAWQSNPRNFNNLGVPSPAPPGTLTGADRRWPYISSFMGGTYVWSADRSTSGTGAWFFSNAYTVVGGAAFTLGVSNFGQRRLSEVQFPSAKIYLWDRGARHFTPRAVYWNFAQAKQPMLFFDGGVINTRTTQTGATERGWDWNAPNQANRSYAYTYSNTSPTQAWMPGWPNGLPTGSALFQAAHFATTREGLRGRDIPSFGPQ